ncbi:MAG TPA: ABC transporter permease [Actinomycetota bacterium]|nr:ABC transporter permease [Actinomycetota bacterium]
MAPDGSRVGQAERAGLGEAVLGEGRTPLQSLMAAPSTWLSLVLLIIIALFSVLRFDSFFSVFNLRNVMIDASSLLIIAVGMTFVIITSGIDLSVGSVLVFSQVVAALVMRDMGGEGLAVILVGLGAGLAAGLGWGLLNGVLVAKTGIPALIVTLGTLGMAQGAALLLSDGINIRGVPTELTTTVGIGRLLGIPYLVLIAVGITILAGVTLRYTRFGRYTYAIGSNDEAARRAGINVSRHLIKVYAMSGLLAGIAGYLSLARFTTTTIAGHETDALPAIAAVVIGGTSLFGGSGGLFGTVVGVFIPAILRNGFVILGVQPFWQLVAVGAVLILAVYVDQVRRRARERA